MAFEKKRHTLPPVITKGTLEFSGRGAMCEWFYSNICFAIVDLIKNEEKRPKLTRFVRKMALSYDAWSQYRETSIHKTLSTRPHSPTQPHPNIVTQSPLRQKAKFYTVFSIDFSQKFWRKFHEHLLFRVTDKIDLIFVFWATEVLAWYLLTISSFSGYFK